MSRKVDTIIVGAGIAGTTLACQLLSRGKSVLLIQGSAPTASRAAAGLFNPITGRHSTITWHAAELFPYLKDFYQTLEKKFGTTFLHFLPVYKPFHSFEEQNSFVAQLSENAYSGFVDEQVNHAGYSEYIHNDKGGFQTLHSGYLDVNHYLDVVLGWLGEQQLLRHEQFNTADIRWLEDGLEWKEMSASNIVFCEGLGNKSNPLFSWVPVNASKGEVLEVHIEQFPEEVVFNKQLFVIPIGKGRYRTGSTYQWKFENDEPSEYGKKDIAERLGNLIRFPFQVEKHWAGIRPASTDRRPYLGRHPRFPHAFIFNGLGAKGVSQAPWFSAMMSDFIINGNEPEPAVNITRLKTLYSQI